MPYPARCPLASRRPSRRTGHRPCLRKTIPGPGMPRSAPPVLQPGSARRRNVRQYQRCCEVTLVARGAVLAEPGGKLRVALSTAPGYPGTDATPTVARSRQLIGAQIIQFYAAADGASAPPESRPCRPQRFRAGPPRPRIAGQPASPIARSTACSPPAGCSLPAGSLSSDKLPNPHDALRSRPFTFSSDIRTGRFPGQGWRDPRTEPGRHARRGQRGSRGRRPRRLDQCVPGRPGPLQAGFR
jgi:hypothetical protein